MLHNYVKQNTRVREAAGIDPELDNQRSDLMPIELQTIICGSP